MFPAVLAILGGWHLDTGLSGRASDLWVVVVRLYIKGAGRLIGVDIRFRWWRTPSLSIDAVIKAELPLNMGWIGSWRPIAGVLMKLVVLLGILFILSDWSEVRHYCIIASRWYIFCSTASAGFWWS